MEGERKQLMTERKMEELGKKKEKLKEELQKKEEEKKDVEQLVDSLVKQKKEMMNQKDQIKVQIEKIEELKKENETKVNEVDKEISEKEGDKTVNKANGYLQLKEIIAETSWSLDERKQEQQTLKCNIDKLMTRTDMEYNTMTDRKKKIEIHMEMINEQLEEINRQREEIQKKP